jgi:hypothetical protein
MGDELLMEIIEATGLPVDLVKQELERIVTGAGLDPAQITLEEVREVMANYLGEILLGAKEAFEA